MVGEQIKADYQHALAHWDTGNLDARRLSILSIKPQQLSTAEIDRMVRTAASPNPTLNHPTGLDRAGLDTVRLNDHTQGIDPDNGEGAARKPCMGE